MLFQLRVDGFRNFQISRIRVAWCPALVVVSLADLRELVYISQAGSLVAGRQGLLILLFGRFKFLRVCFMALLLNEREADFCFCAALRLRASFDFQLAAFFNFQLIQRMDLAVVVSEIEPERLTSIIAIAGSEENLLSIR